MPNTPHAILEDDIETLIASGARSVDVAGVAEGPGHYKGFLILVDCTVDPASGAVTPRVQVKDVNGDWTTYVNFTAFAATGEFQYLLYPGATHEDITDGATMPLPPEFRLLFDVTSAGSLTYSVRRLWLR